jgi:hypothetical protein
MNKYILKKGFYDISAIGSDVIKSLIFCPKALTGGAQWT